MDERARSVRRMQDYIGEHLNEQISLGDLARVCMYSPWYAHRLFAHYTGLTPADYIRRLRLSKSALMLRDENVLVSDVAFMMGFSSVDGYQRAFLREFGINPKQYARSPSPICLFMPYGVQYERREYDMSNVKTVFIQSVDKAARKVIIKRGVKAEDYWTYCGEVGCDVWGILTSMKSTCGEPVCLWLPNSYIKPGTSKYVQGVEVDIDYDGCVPEGFEVIELPASKYLMFCGEPFKEEDFEQAIGEIWEAEKKFDPSLSGLMWDDSAPRIQLEPRGERGYIELMPVRENK